MRRKHTKRLSDAELARRLEEDGLIERGVLDALLEQVGDEGMLCEALHEMYRERPKGEIVYNYTLGGWLGKVGGYALSHLRQV